MRFIGAVKRFSKRAALIIKYKQVLISLSITLNLYKKRNLRANNLKSISLNREKVAPRRGALARPTEQNTKVLKRGKVKSIYEIRVITLGPT